MPESDPGEFRPIGYVWRWIRETIVSTLQSAHRAALLTSLLALAATTLIRSLAYPTPHGHPTLVFWEFTWPGLGAGAGVFFLFLVVNFLITPVRLARQEHETQNLLSTKLSVEEDAHNKLREYTAQEPLTNRHFAELQSILRGITESIDKNRKCAFDNPKDADSLFSHFPLLEPMVESWNSSIQFVYESSAHLERRMVSECGNLGLNLPTFHTDAIVREVLHIIIAQAEYGQSTLPFELTWREFGQCLYFGTGGSPIIFLDAPGETRTKAQLSRPIEQLMVAAPKWPETAAFIDRDRASGWPNLKVPFLDQLDDLLKRDYFKKGGGCPRCN